MVHVLALRACALCLYIIEIEHHDWKPPERLLMDTNSGAATPLETPFASFE